MLIPIIYERRGIFQCPDRQRGADEPAFHVRRVDGGSSLPVPDSVFCGGRLGGRADPGTVPVRKEASLAAEYSSAGDRYFVCRRVSFPPGLDMMATALVSFSCAMQVQSFRKVNGYSYASTMCIGNLRGGIGGPVRLCPRAQVPAGLRNSCFYYFGIIVLFAVGAGLGGNLSIHYGIQMIWVCCAFLLISFLLCSTKQLRRRKFYKLLKKNQKNFIAFTS